MKIPVTFAALCLLILFLGLDPSTARPLLRFVAFLGILLTLAQLVDFRLIKSGD